jgi:hypothetical protein
LKLLTCLLYLNQFKEELGFFYNRCYEKMKFNIYLVIQLIELCSKNLKFRHRLKIACIRNDPLTKKLIIFIFIFITGLYNKPQGCGASVASAAGPFSTKKKQLEEHLMINIRLYCAM